jgi:hypothetical protein
MKGRDITKMKGWDKLSALGFVPVKFRGQMGFYEIGAALQRRVGPCTDGKTYKVDAVTVEPSVYFTNAKGKRVGHWTINTQREHGITWAEGRTVIAEAIKAAARV